MSIQLHVVGDSHSAFWNGSQVSFGRRMIAEIETHRVDDAFSPDAIAAAIPKGHPDWLLLNFGKVDYASEILERAHVTHLEEALNFVVDAYVARIVALRNMYTKLAVFGPLAASSHERRIVTIGNVLERNLVLATFSTLLRDRLSAHDIPLLSVLDVMLAEDGTTLQHYFEDGEHLSQIAMPCALAEVNDLLGLQIRGVGTALSIVEERVSIFASVERVAKFGVEWTEFTLPGEARFISEAVVAQDIFAPLQKITVATTLDDDAYPSASFEFRGPVEAAKAVISLPIGRFAKKIMFCAEMGYLERYDVDIFGKTTELGKMSTYSKASLFALRAELLPKTTIPVVAEDIVSVRSKKLSRS